MKQILFKLTTDIFIDEGEKAEATAIEEARMIAVVFMVDSITCNDTKVINRNN